MATPPAPARVPADRMWLERVAEQAGWRGGTDPERLTGAFTALQKAGITARENFAATGCAVVAALEGVGLHTEWDEAPGRAVTGTPLNGRRRLVGAGTTGV